MQGWSTPTTGGKGRRERFESVACLPPPQRRPKKASSRFFRERHLQAISPWQPASKNSSSRLLYAIRLTQRYVEKPPGIRDRTHIKGQWWLGRGRNGQVRSLIHDSKIVILHATDASTLSSHVVNINAIKMHKTHYFTHCIFKLPLPQFLASRYCR